MNDWLKELKEGDIVAVSRKYGGFDMRKVERFTKTQIVLESGARFNRQTGYGVGDTPGFLHVATPERIALASRERLVAEVTGRCRSREVSSETLQAILDLLNA